MRIYVNQKYLKDMVRDGEFLYLLQIGDIKEGKRKIKIGTTNNMGRRMKEHLKTYKEDIYVIWCKRVSSKWTTLKKEDDNKKYWIDNAEWEYLRNDRFIIPACLTEVVIKIRKKYHIKFDCVCWEYYKRKEG